MQLGYVHAHRIAPPFPHSPSPIPRPPIPQFPHSPFSVPPLPVTPLPVLLFPVPPFPVPPFPVPPFPVPGFKDSRFQSISRFSTEKTIFLHVFNLQTLKTSLLLVFYSYVHAHRILKANHAVKYVKPMVCVMYLTF